MVLSCILMKLVLLMMCEMLWKFKQSIQIYFSYSENVIVNLTLIEWRADDISDCDMTLLVSFK